MLKTVHEIARAQDFLKEQHGEDDYRKMVDRLQVAIAKHGGSDVELVVLADMAKDEELSPTLRLLAVATMGE